MYQVETYQTSENRSHAPQRLPGFWVEICSCANSKGRMMCVYLSLLQFTQQIAHLVHMTDAEAPPVIDMQIFAFGANRPLGVHITMLGALKG